MHHSFSERSRSKTVRETFEKYRAIKENISPRSFDERSSTGRTSPVRLFSERRDLGVGDASVGRCMQTSSPGYGIERAVIRDVYVAADLGEERIIRSQPGHEKCMPPLRRQLVDTPEQRTEDKSVVVSHAYEGGVGGAQGFAGGREWMAAREAGRCVVERAGPPEFPGVASDDRLLVRRLVPEPHDARELTVALEDDKVLDAEPERRRTQEFLLAVELEELSLSTVLVQERGYPRQVLWHCGADAGRLISSHRPCANRNDGGVESPDLLEARETGPGFVDEQAPRLVILAGYGRQVDRNGVCGVQVPEESQATRDEPAAPEPLVHADPTQVADHFLLPVDPNPPFRPADHASQLLRGLMAGDDYLITVARDAAPQEEVRLPFVSYRHMAGHRVGSEEPAYIRLVFLRRQIQPAAHPMSSGVRAGVSSKGSVWEAFTSSISCAASPNGSSLRCITSRRIIALMTKKLRHMKKSLALTSKSRLRLSIEG